MADFERSERGDVTLLAVRGSLDAKTAAELKPEVVAIGDSGTKKVVVDLAGLTLIDSSGVAEELGGGTVFLLPYHMGMYHGFVARP